MTDGIGPLRADGDRVWVASATERDQEAYVRASETSRRRLSEWNPVDPYGLPLLIRAASRYHRTLLIHASAPEGGHDLVGKVNVTNVVLGRALTGTLGYDAFDPYAGHGLFAEGLRLAVDLAFAPIPHGMGLQRLEANVQPGNVRSGAVLRRLGFRREGFSPAYLLMPAAGGGNEWRDHDRYAVTAAEWPAEPFQPARLRRTVVVVDGPRGRDTTTFARRLARELALPLVDGTLVDVSAWGALVADAPAGAVLLGDLSGPARATFGQSLAQAGVDPARVVEVRRRIPAGGGPSGDRPVIEVGDAGELSDRDLVVLALRVRAAASV